MPYSPKSDYMQIPMFMLQSRNVLANAVGG